MTTVHCLATVNSPIYCQTLNNNVIYVKFHWTYHHTLWHTYWHTAWHNDALPQYRHVYMTCQHTIWQSINTLTWHADTLQHNDTLNWHADTLPWHAETLWWHNDTLILTSVVVVSPFQRWVHPWSVMEALVSVIQQMKHIVVPHHYHHNITMVTFTDCTIPHFSNAFL